MTDTYNGIPYPSYWAALDTHKQRAWKAGAISAIAHLGQDEARKLASELEATNGPLMSPEPDDRTNARYQVYQLLRGQLLHASQLDGTGRLRSDIAMSLSRCIVDTLVAKGWGDLSVARIELTSAKIAYQDALAEHSKIIADCNETIKRITGGR